LCTKQRSCVRVRAECPGFRIVDDDIRTVIRKLGVIFERPLQPLSLRRNGMAREAPAGAHEIFARGHGVFLGTAGYLLLPAA